MATMIAQFAVAVADLLAALLFMLGLWRMSSPVTAASGIFVAGLGMLGAVLASFLYVLNVTAQAQPRVAVNFGLALLALGLGGGAAWWSGKNVAMRAMPQMVALYIGMGSGAAAAIAVLQLLGHKTQDLTQLVLSLLVALFGAAAFSGALVAWAKLGGWLRWRWQAKHVHAGKVLALLLTLALGCAIVSTAQQGLDSVVTAPLAVYLFLGCALALGVLATLPIGVDGMPVVVSVFNALTGLAVGLEGLVLQNLVLVVAGMLVSVTGLLLSTRVARTQRGFERHMPDAVHGSLKAVDAADAGIAMRYANKVIIVPGYGLAISQAHYKLHAFVQLLQAAGVMVKLALPSPAGPHGERAPGQVDVLLAQAGLPCELMFQREAINDEFSSADVVLVIGANDAVNPAPRGNSSSPLHGLPVLNVYQAKRVFVVKRGQGRGHAGMVNTLFYRDNCNMVYGDAQAVLAQMIEAVTQLELVAAAQRPHMPVPYVR